MPRWTIDWVIQGTYEVEAKTAEEAQEKFDKAWGKPKGIMPERDGEVSSAKPERST